MAAYQVGDGNAEGVIFPDTKLGFFNTTPAARPDVANSATITATWVTISDGAQGFGFSTSDQIISVIAVIKQMQHVLTTLGLWE